MRRPRALAAVLAAACLAALALLGSAAPAASTAGTAGRGALAAAIADGLRSNGLWVEPGSDPPSAERLRSAAAEAEASGSPQRFAVLKAHPQAVVDEAVHRARADIGFDGTLLAVARNGVVSGEGPGVTPATVRALWRASLKDRSLDPIARIATVARQIRQGAEVVTSLTDLTTDGGSGGSGIGALTVIPIVAVVLLAALIAGLSVARRRGRSG